jgi:hypothetical protein
VFRIPLSTHFLIVQLFQMAELKEFNIPAMICQNCFKELYQCFNFRKKCQSAAEFFRTQSNRFETQQWKVEEEVAQESSDLNNLKMEHFEKTLVEDDVELNSYEFLPDLDDVKADESFTEDLVEEIVETKPTTRSLGFRRRSKKRFEEPTKSTRNVRSNLECKYCGIKLSRRNRLIQHERLHVLDQTQDFYICFFCGKTFNQKFGLIPHFKSAHNCLP